MTVSRTPWHVRRVLVGGICLVLGLLAVTAMHYLLPEETANVLLNKPTARMLADSSRDDD